MFLRNWMFLLNYEVGGFSGILTVKFPSFPSKRMISLIYLKMNCLLQWVVTMNLEYWTWSVWVNVPVYFLVNLLQYVTILVSDWQLVWLYSTWNFNFDCIWYLQWDFNLNCNFLYMCLLYEFNHAWNFICNILLW